MAHASSMQETREVPSPSLWRRWTEPSEALTDIGDRRSARLLAKLLLILIPLGLLSALPQALLVPGFGRQLFIILVAVALLGVAYGVCRTVYFRAAGVAASLLPVVASGAIGVTSPADHVWFAFMNLGTVLASAILPARHVSIIAGITVAVTASALGIRSDLLAGGEIIAVLAFSVSFSLLVVLATRHRGGVERERQAEIRESQSLYRILFESAPLGIGVASMEGRLLAFNDAMLRPGRFQREDLERLTNVAEHYYDPEAREAVMARVRRGESVAAAEVRMRDRDGTPYYVSLSLVPITYHGQQCTLAISEDITERKRAEADRRDLAGIIEKSLNEVYLFDTATLLFEYANECAQRDLGYSMTQLRTLTALDVKPEFDETTFRTLLAPLLRGEKGLLTFETVHRRADGTTYPVEVRLQLAQRSGRSVFLAFVSDISARKKAEMERERMSTQLRTQERRFERLIESSSDLVALAGPGLELLQLNPAFEQILGYRMQEWIGKSILQLIYHEDLTKAHALVARSAGAPGEAIAWELRVRHADGSLRWLEGTGTNYLGDPATRGILINCRDITERRRTEDVVRQNELRLRVAIDSANLSVFEMDTDLRYTWMYSPQLGYSPQQVVGRDDHDLFGDDGLPIVAMKRRVLESARSAREEVSVRLGGKTSWLDLTVEPIRADTGAVVGVRGASFDISEAKALHARFLQAQKMETVGRLAGGIAHDFNNVLMVIEGTAGLAAAELRPDDPLQEDLEQIRRAGQRAAALTAQLLAFSRKQVLQPVVVNLYTLVSDITTMLRRVIGEDIDLIVQPAAAVANIKADPGQMEQVIMNLAVNSRDAMPRGGSLTIGMQNVTLTEAEARALSVPAGAYVRLALHDTGMGMDGATRERIFEPFFTTKEVGTGTGLGLSTVLGIVQQSGGTIEVHSEVGDGCTFHIYLPAVEEPVPEARPTRTAIDPRGRETILVVEDEERITSVLKRALVSTGYQVLTAASGAEALRLLEQHEGRLDLLLTDLVMPHMSGTELKKHLASGRPGTKVLYMSGFSEAALMLPEDDAQFIGKPFSIAELRRKVREVLDSSDPHPRKA